MNRGRVLFCLAGVMAVFFVFPSLSRSASVMVDKNIFSPDRKPPTDEPAAAAPLGNKPGVSAKSIQLDGVIIHGDAKKALVRVKGQSVANPNEKGKGQNPYVAVKEGARVAEYLVTRIEPKSITLEKEGQTYVVNLFAEGKTLSPLAPVPATPVTTVPSPEARQPAAPVHPVPRATGSEAGTGGEAVARTTPGAVLPMPQPVPQQLPSHVGVPVPEENVPEEMIEEEAVPDSPTP